MKDEYGHQPPATESRLPDSVRERIERHEDRRIKTLADWDSEYRELEARLP